MSDKGNGKLSHKDIEELFGTGTVIVFKCEATSDFPLLFVSSNVEQILGFSPEYFLNDHETGWSSRVHPDDLEEVKRGFHKLLDGECTSHVHEYRFKAADGRYIWLRDEIKMKFDDEGEYESILGSSFEITQKQNKMQYHKNLTQAVIDSLPGVFLMVDEDQRLLRWNDNLQRLSGYSAEELEAMTSWDFLNKDDFDFVKGKIEKVKRNQSEGTEVEIITKDGSVIPYFWKSQLFNDGERNYFLTIGIDISQRVAMEKDLLNEKRFNEAIIQSLPGIFYVLNEGGQFIRWNENFVEEIGYSPEEISRMNPLDFYDPEDRALVEEKIGEVFEKGSADAELYPVTKSGDKIPYYMKAVHFERDGKKYLVGNGYDISEHKKVIRELKQSVEEKHVLLQEIHHRVKNNMAIVSSLLQLQMYEQDDPELTRLLQESQGRINTMGLIHEQLYNSASLSRIEIKSYILDLLESIKDTFECMANNVEFTIDIEPVELTINKAVPFALIINEVVTNSLEHAFLDREKGTIAIRIEKKGGELEAVLSDNGRGLPEQENRKNGLGMTLIENLLNQLEANWELQNGEGVTYRLTFNRDDSKGSSSILVS